MQETYMISYYLMASVKDVHCVICIPSLMAFDSAVQ